jgi:hypothetical protein
VFNQSSKRAVDPRNGAGRHRNDTNRVDAVRLRSVLVNTPWFDNSRLHGRSLRRFFEPGINRALPDRRERQSRKVPVTSIRRKRKKHVRATEIGSLRLRNKVPERVHQITETGGPGSERSIETGLQARFRPLPRRLQRFRDDSS